MKNTVVVSVVIWPITLLVTYTWNAISNVWWIELRNVSRRARKYVAHYNRRGWHIIVTVILHVLNMTHGSISWQDLRFSCPFSIRMAGAIRTGGHILTIWHDSCYVHCRTTTLELSIAILSIWFHITDETYETRHQQYLKMTSNKNNTLRSQQRRHDRMSLTSTIPSGGNSRACVMITSKGLQSV